MLAMHVNLLSAHVCVRVFVNAGQVSKTACRDRDRKMLHYAMFPIAEWNSIRNS